MIAMRIQALCLFRICMMPLSSMADDSDAATLPELIAETTQNNPLEGQLDELTESIDIRLDALKQAAASYGARGGLAKRTEEIRVTIDQQAAALDRIYDFKRLLVPAPSGLFIEPPIISEGENATLIEAGGQTAAVADRIFNINREAELFQRPRNWRAYLEREWGEVALPPQILCHVRPRSGVFGLII